jgi:hypothetical protein
MPRPYVYGQLYCVTLTALLKTFISDAGVEHLSGCPRNYRTIAEQTIDDDLAVPLEVACATLEGSRSYGERDSAAKGSWLKMTTSPSAPPRFSPGGREPG